MVKPKKEFYRKANRKFVIDLVEQGEKVTPATKKMCEAFNLQYDENIARAYRSIMQKKGVTTNTAIDEVLETAKTKQFDNSKKRFIISWAQQDTAVHEQFLNNIEAYASYISAEVLIIAGRYKNSTSLEGSKKQQKKDKDKSNWHPRVAPYLIASRQNIHEHLTILADVKINPTAITPLTGFNGFTALESCIIGFPSVHLKSLPVLDSYPNKLLLTTGSVTLENYSDSRAGKRGEFNHTLGFVVVELDGDIFHVRQVQCSEDGSFYDLFNYTHNGFTNGYEDACPSLVLGDLHLTSEDKVAVDKSFEIASWSRPNRIVVHDVLDSASISHHEQKNPFLLAQREIDGSNNLEAELEYLVDWFNDKKHYHFVSVMSNHCEWLDRWVKENDWRKSNNRKIYLELASAVMEGKAPKGLLPYLLDKHTTNVTSLSYNDSYRVGDWELALHGDKGSSGSRGSVMQFKNLNTKTVVGHSHTPVRDLGCLSVGTLTKLRLPYNAGLSSWLHSNVLIYPNYKASHIHIIKGKYTTL